MARARPWTSSACGGSRRTSYRPSPSQVRPSPSRRRPALLADSIARAGDIKIIYACHLELANYLVNRDGKPFEREQYRKHPDQFESVFHTKVRLALHRSSTRST